jgi:hypothetical protein
VTPIKGKPPTIDNPNSIDSSLDNPGESKIKDCPLLKELVLIT